MSLHWSILARIIRGVGALTGLRPKGIFVKGFRATIHTATLFKTGEKPGVRAKSLLIYNYQLAPFIKRETCTHLIRNISSIHQIPTYPYSAQNDHSNHISHFTDSVGLLRMSHISEKIRYQSMSSELVVSSLW